MGCAGVTIAEVGGEGLLHQAGWRSCHFEFWGCSHAAGILGLIPVLHVFLPLAHANMECSELGVEVPHHWLSQRDAWPFVLPQLRYRRTWPKKFTISLLACQQQPGGNKMLFGFSLF